MIETRILIIAAVLHVTRASGMYYDVRVSARCLSNRKEIKMESLLSFFKSAVGQCQCHDANGQSSRAGEIETQCTKETRCSIPRISSTYPYGKF